MSIDDEINRTKSKIGDLRRQISNLERHGIDLALKKLGLELGDIIEVTKLKKTFLVSVDGVDSWSSMPTPRGYKIKKDGSVGNQYAGYIREWKKGRLCT